jgi:hypothetical protein
MSMRHEMRASSFRASATSKTKLTALFVLAVIAACGISADAPETPDIFGTYSLSAVNGAALPATVKVNNVDQTFTSGSLSLTDSSYQFAVCVQSAGTTSACGPGYNAFRESGTWYATGMHLVFMHDTDGGTETATIGNEQLTVPYGTTGVQFSFLKE